MTATWRILEGDCRDVLRSLDAGSVQTCVTSPPYFGLRDYGHDGQIGLEPTPDEFVAALVGVFREVRRVLRDDGTAWLNLGDSYNSTPPGNKNPMSKSGLNGAQTSVKYRERLEETQQRQQEGRSLVAGCKPKDLLGIPWMVAFALRQPYYAGTITNELDRVWLAAMIDAEGCIYIHRRPEGASNGQGYVRKADSFGSGLEVANTNLRVVERCMEITGRGSISRQDKDRRQPLYRWCLRTNECRDVLREVYPYLVAKQHEARIACGVPSSGERATAAWEALKILHGGGLTDVDFKAPESLHTPGWYLRSDVIWSKLNPMPESVQDRPTKAHEYLFLLSKGPRYFYDADAIREDASPATIERAASGNGRAVHSAENKNRHRDGADRAGASSTYFGRDFAADAERGRNKRSVWTVATQPFSGFDRRVRVERDAVGDDIQRTTSPGCPVHGGQPVPAPTAQRGGRAAAPLRRSPDTYADPAQGLLLDCAPTDRPSAQGSPAGSSDSPDLEPPAIGNGHSIRSHRTDLAAATTQPCTPSAGSALRTPGTSDQPASSAPHPGTSDRSSGEGGSGDLRASGTPDRTAHRPSSSVDSACTCEFYRVERMDHFATFPPKLIEPCILAGCPEGGTVLDPFAGAGTTGMVALRHGRSFVGIELSPEYVRLARDRIIADSPLLNTYAEFDAA